MIVKTINLFAKTIYRIYELCEIIFFLIFVNTLSYTKIISDESMSRLVHSLANESLPSKFNLKLKNLENSPEYSHLSSEELSNLYRSIFLQSSREIDNFCTVLVWNRNLSKSFSKEIKKSLMRKVAWDLRCKGIIFDHSDLVS